MNAIPWRRQYQAGFYLAQDSKKFQYLTAFT
jgi:hypothetical protein